MSIAQLRAAVENTWRDYAADGVPSSGAHEPIKSDIRATLGPLLETVLSSIGAGILRYATKALMDADTDEADGQLAYVYDDAVAANNKVYQWDDGGNVWVAAEWYFDAVAGVVDEHLQDAIIQRGTIFLDEATGDDFAKAFFREITVAGADKRDQLWLNYENAYFPGIPLWRFRWRLHSTLYAMVVAQWDLTSATDPTADLPEKAHMTLMVDGSHAYGDDPGITALVVPDWDALEYNNVLTAYAGPTETGLKPDVVETTEGNMAKWTVPAAAAPPEWVMTVGPSGDFPTFCGVGSAQEYIENSPDLPATIARSTYPGTNLFMPERPLIVRANATGYSEEITPFTHLAIDQSPLRIHHGMQLHLPYRDTDIFMDSVGSTAPVVEFNFTGAIYGEGRLRQLGPGYVVHIDNSNALSLASPVDPLTLRRRLQTIIRDVTLQKVPDNSTPIIGCGLSNGQYLLLDGPRLIMDANTTGTDFILVHTSPGTTHGGLVHLHGVQANVAAGIATLALQKSHAMAEQHGVLVQESDCDRIEVGNTAGGDPGFRARCSLAGITVVGVLG